MNTRTLLSTAALACTALAGLAQADDTSSTQGQAPAYHYGMPLHIAKVISLTEPMTLYCEVVTAEMKYIDTSGNPARISYRKLSDACSMQS